MESAGSDIVFRHFVSSANKYNTELLSYVVRNVVNIQ